MFYDIYTNLTLIFLQAIQSLDAGDYRINVSVSDGKYLTYTDVRLHVWSITDEMAENAIIIRFEQIPADEFMALHKAKLIRVRIYMEILVFLISYLRNGLF